ncbi:hypothetical protein ACXZ1M_14335 [Duganella sp. PWIR1]
MLDVLNGIYLAVTLFSGITLYPTDETPVPLERDAYVELQLHREYWREDGNGKCSFKGVLAPYARTWPLEVRRGDETVILPPEPDKIAGYVVVVNRKVCKGQEPEAILRAGNPSPRKPFFGKLQVDLHTFFAAGDMLETPADKMPPWMPQVVEHLAVLAKTDKKANDFILASLPELNKALPGLPALARYTLSERPDLKK